MGKLRERRLARRRAFLKRKKELAKANKLVRSRHLEIISKNKPTKNKNG